MDGAGNKKYSIFALIALVCFLLIMSFCTTEGAEIKNPINATSIAEVVDNFIDLLFYITVVAAPLMVVIAGFLFATARDDVEQVSKAKKMIIWAGIGLLIVLLSKGIYEAIETVVGN